MQYVRTRVLEEKKYILLQPGNHPARTNATGQVGPYQKLATYRDIDWTCHQIAASEFVALDFETRGNDYSHPDFGIVGIGLAWETGSCYFHWDTLKEEAQTTLREALLSHRGILCHNLYFDGGVAYSQWGQRHLEAAACTYSLTAHLANESPEQRWGLKDLMVNLLGWAESNEKDLDEWLVSHGYYKGNRLVDTSPENLITKLNSGAIRPDKGEMWRAPKSILGKYCVLDAEATYLLFTEVLRPALDQYPGLIQQQEEFLHLVRQLIEQKCGGINLDRDAVLGRQSLVQTGMADFVQSLRGNPLVAPHIATIEARIRKDLYEKQPEKFKKDGGISKNFEKWETKCNLANAGQLPDYNFNINSDFHLRALLYDHLGFPVKQTTESGLPGAGIKALQAMGEVGKLLIEYNYLQKELGFLESYLHLTEDRLTIHPSFRTPGTVTGRLSSKEPNLQQVPKTRTMMEFFQCKPGTVWVDIDFAALESVVAAEFSQDTNLLALYGDNVPENDVHLFVAAQVPGEMGETVLRTGYTPLNPPPGTVSKAKKEAKRWRSIAKTVVYACQFGAGVDRVLATLEAENVFLPRDQVEIIHSTYWDTFSKLKDFSKGLWYEWRRNKGFILNGMGRPMCVPESYTKDLLSRFIQSTGHDILVKYIYILTAELKARGIPYRPVIIDWHDATTVEVPESYQQATIDTMDWSMGELNNQLGGIIRMRGKPTWGRNLADIKEPEE